MEAITSDLYNYNYNYSLFLIEVFIHKFIYLFLNIIKKKEKRYAT